MSRTKKERGELYLSAFMGVAALAAVVLLGFAAVSHGPENLQEAREMEAAAFTRGYMEGLTARWNREVLDQVDACNERYRVWPRLSESEAPWRSDR